MNKIYHKGKPVAVYYNKEHVKRWNYIYLVGLAVIACVMATSWQVEAQNGLQAPRIVVEPVLAKDLVVDTEITESPAQAKIEPTSDIPEYERLIRQYFPRDQWDNALKIAWCESRYESDRTNTNASGSQDHGLYQINDVHRQRFTGDLYNLEYNIQVASQLWSEQGFSPWVCAKILGIK